MQSQCNIFANLPLSTEGCWSGDIGFHRHRKSKKENAQEGDGQVMLHNLLHHFTHTSIEEVM